MIKEFAWTSTRMITFRLNETAHEPKEAREKIEEKICDDLVKHIIEVEKNAVSDRIKKVLVNETGLNFTKEGRVDSEIYFEILNRGQQSDNASIQKVISLSCTKS